MNRTIYHIHIILFIVTSLLLSILNVYDANASNNSSKIAASVIAVRGQVKATDISGTSRELKIKDPIFLEDTIITGNRGRIQILFSDNSIISLSRKSNMKIIDYHLAQDKTGRLATKVNEGVFRVMGGMLTKTSPDNFKTETPSGNIGIRGSMYTGQVSDKGTSVVFEGGKGITFRNSRGMISISKPGIGTKASGYNSSITKPYKFSSKDIGAMRRELSFQSSNTQSSSRSQSSSSLRAPVTFTPNSVSKPAQKTEGTKVDQAPAGEDLPTTDEKAAIDSEDPLLTEQAKSNPEDAAILLENAVSNQGLDVNSAMKSVLLGMQNANNENFEKLINEYIESGGTIEDAQKILGDLKTDPGGVCK